MQNKNCRFKRHLLAWGLLISLPWYTAFIQAADRPVEIEGRPLSLDDAIQTALTKNADILRARQSLEQSIGQIIEVRAQTLPNASIVGSYSQQDRNLIDSSVQDKSWRIALEGKQLLYSGGQVSAAMRMAKTSKNLSIYQLEDTIDRTLSQVRQQFYATLLNRALIKVQEESIELLKQELSEQQSRYEAGTVPRFNVLRAEVELANARPDLIRARNGYRIAQLLLARTIGEDSSELSSPYQLPFKPVGSLQTPIREMDFQAALIAAKENRPFLKAQKENIYMEADQIRIALGGYYPNLSAVGGYEVINDSKSDDIKKALDGWFAGIQGSWDIFDGFATAGRVKQARARLESAKIMYEDSTLQVELEVQDALSRLQEAKELIESQQKNVEQAQEALRLARERFSAGAGTQLEILDARVALTRAQTTELQARYDYNIALASYEYATGIATGYDNRFLDLQPQIATKEIQNITQKNISEPHTLKSHPTKRLGKPN